MRTITPPSATAIQVGTELYLLRYDRESANEALRTLGRWASDQELSFSWFDAAIAANQIRNQYQGASR
jgi:hypothetical protein